ncbi:MULTISPECIES: class I SAM-dependent methyltransferase [unclassified Nocardia]|uniref:class I SAM-dependent methyltransferase n=1 Tax=unclassified Nocardia TaxID=2637762 RepID=UPI001CE3F36E|nr:MULTISPECIES: class I SAM-dependent methyltransferase [unclassified Nocardia]
MTEALTIDRCRVCGNTRLETVVDLGTMALTGVFPAADAADVPRYPLELVRCVRPEPSAADPDECGLVQLRHTANFDEMYSAGYGYRSGLNRSMIDHLGHRVARIRARIDLSPDDLVIDIGSNDATLLKWYPPGAASVVGIDPLAAKFREFYPPHLRVVPGFFGTPAVADALNGKRAKVITSVAMFYDVPDPLGFMRAVRDALTDDGIWVLEQSYLPAMLATTSYDTICHEHLEYYTLDQIEWMARRSGFTVLEVERNTVNGGSFALTLAKHGTPAHADAAALAGMRAEEAALGLHGPQLYADFAKRVDQHRDRIRDFFDRSRQAGLCTLGYGASTKGNVLLQYCGIGPAELPCLAEVNPDKFGKFTPGTAIPIVPEAEARAQAPDQFFVLPWHFRTMLVEREREFLESGGRLVFPLPELGVV